MKQIFQRLTLARPATFAGKGLHSGLPVQLNISSGDDGLVLIFEGKELACSIENVTDTSRCTKVGMVSTVEHLVSAMGGLGITDARIEVLGNPEIPALDGCAETFVRGLTIAGTVACGELEIDGPYARVYSKTEESSIAIASGNGDWRCTFDLGDRWPGIQKFEHCFSTGDYLKDIAPARTFALEEEMEWIRVNGLGLGLDETTAFVIGLDRYLNPTRFSDEPVRHKLLDLAGDLYLSGIPLRALNVVAEKSGHRANIEACSKLAEHVKITRK